MFIFDPNEFDDLYRFEDFDMMNDDEETEEVDFEPYDYDVPVFCPYRQSGRPPQQPGRPPQQPGRPPQQPGRPPQQPGRPPRPPMGGMGGWPGGGPQGGPPWGGPQGGPSGGAQGGPPKSGPPSFTPQQQSGSMLKVDPGSIRPCTFRFVYIWLNNGSGFWAWLVYVGRNSVSGWRWTGWRWVYFGIDTRRIASFTCF